MTYTANARLAGFTFLAYIATGILSMILFSRAAAGTSAVARLASIGPTRDHSTLCCCPDLAYLLRGSRSRRHPLGAHPR